MRLRESSAQDDNSSRATWAETAPVAMAALLLGVAALIVCFSNGYLLLYGDAVAHLGIARRVYDSRTPGLMQLVGVWLPLPHLLMLPFVQKMAWWQNGLAAAWPSLGCYVLGVVGFFRLCRRVLTPRWAWAATAFYGLNPNLLYLSTTAMTEPLFLVLLIWMTLMTMECVEAIRAAETGVVSRRLVVLGVLILAGVFARYDGWVLGATVWCVVTWQLWRARRVWREVAGAFVIFTLLAVAGPALWIGLNQYVFHDPLWFMRGPYSAVAVEKKTSPPWPLDYPGLHNPARAMLIYMRTAQLDAAVWETGFAVMALALAGLWIAVRRRAELGAAWWAVLLWVPLVFYAYSMAYGSEPIFVPELWPHAHYNVRFGMELLPALALYACLAAAALEARVARGRLVYGAVLGLVGVNALAMIYGVAVVRGAASLVLRRPVSALGIYTPPLVLREAVQNSLGRSPFDRNLALELEKFPKGSTILMAQADHIGALQNAGIPLRQTVNGNDFDSVQAAQNIPAKEAQYVVAFEGDLVSKAVAQHPEGLEEMTTVCGMWEPCARIYRSTEFARR